MGRPRPERRKASRALRYAAGLCVDCPAPRDCASSRCAACRDRMRLVVARLRVAKAGR